jgi:hypothetical protein
LIQEALTFFKMLFVVKSVPIVQEIYKKVLTDTEMSLSTLLDNKRVLMSASYKLNSNTGLERLKNPKQAESNLIFNLSAFEELGNAKNNLISVY